MNFSPPLGPCQLGIASNLLEMPIIFSSVLDCCCIHLFRVAQVLLATLRPNVLPLDLMMPDKDGLAVIEEVNFDLLPTKVICMTCSDDSRDAVRTMNPRARGVVLRQSATDLFEKCIHHVVAGEIWLENHMATGLVKPLSVSSESDVRREPVVPDVTSLYGPAVLISAPWTCPRRFIQERNCE